MFTHHNIEVYIRRVQVEQANQILTQSLPGCSTRTHEFLFLNNKNEFTLRFMVPMRLLGTYSYSIKTVAEKAQILYFVHIIYLRFSILKK